MCGVSRRRGYSPERPGQLQATFVLEPWQTKVITQWEGWRARVFQPRKLMYAGPDCVILERFLIAGEPQTPEAIPLWVYKEPTIQHVAFMTMESLVLTEARVRNVSSETVQGVIVLDGVWRD